MRSRGLSVVATTRRKDRVALDRPFLDLAAPLDTWEPPPQTEAVCLCAAVARLAVCAADPQATAYINVQQTLMLIEKLLARDIHVLFLSTNQVFDGRAPHVSANAAYSPVSEYGQQKAHTEAALREHIARGAPAAILRLAKVVSPDMPLIRGWVGDLSAGKPIRAFDDMTLAPTPTGLVCAAIASLLEDRARGIFQLTGPRDVAYADVGRFVAAQVGAAGSMVEETSARAAGLPEGATPRNTTLDSTLLREQYGMEVPDVWEVIEPIIASGRDQRFRQSTGSHF